MITFKQLGRYGRLGNQMFQIASTIGIAIKNGHDYSFPKWINYDHKERFGSVEDDKVYKYFANELPEYKCENCEPRFIHWGYHDLEFHRGNYDLSGHMQSEKYFSHCADKIKEVFTMKDEYEQNNYCAVHMRLGDYDDNYHPRLKEDYYKEAMKQMPANTEFLIFSDEPEIASRMFRGHKVYISTYLDAFKKMKSCKHFIIGNSTYSWWAAWLGNHSEKIVVAPKKWFGIIAGLDTTDIYAKDWIVI